MSELTREEKLEIMQEILSPKLDELYTLLSRNGLKSMTEVTFVARDPNNHNMYIILGNDPDMSRVAESYFIQVDRSP